MSATELFIIETFTPDNYRINGCVAKQAQIVGEIVNLSGDHRTAAIIYHWQLHFSAIRDAILGFPLTHWNLVGVETWPLI